MKTKQLSCQCLPQASFAHFFTRSFANKNSLHAYQKALKSKINPRYPSSDQTIIHNSCAISRNYCSLNHHSLLNNSTKKMHQTNSQVHPSKIVEYIISGASFIQMILNAQSCYSQILFKSRTTTGYLAYRLKHPRYNDSDGSLLTELRVRGG